MPSVDAIIIDLPAAVRCGQPSDFELGDAFFKALDQDEITGGSLCVRAKVRELHGEVFHVDYHIAGTVRTLCDRCLEDVSFEVELDDEVNIYTDGEEHDDDMARSLSPRSKVYDAGWDVYEAVEVSLPLQRVHPDGKCGPGVPDIVLRETDDDGADIDDGMGDEE